MSVWKHQPHQEEPAELTPEELAAEQARLRLEFLQTQIGDTYCSARGCTAQTGVYCAYIDRRERPCPTAWCPEHRHVTHDAVFCSIHAGLVDGTTTMFGDTAHPDLENQTPALVNWVAREMQEDIQAMVESIATELDETVVVDPVRFILFGVDRVRTWDRSWKTVTIAGHSLRVAVAVEERRPDVVLGKVNSKNVVDVPAPWHEEHMVGVEPKSAEDGEQQIKDFHSRLFLEIARVAETWRLAQLEERATSTSTDVQATYNSG
jgi:hypothetical protein